VNDYVFADYRAFMDHAKLKHHICGISSCDAVFRDLTSMDLHQAEYHKKKVTLRMAHKNSDDESEPEEDKKIPDITSEQYKRMNEEGKNENFPTLKSNPKIYIPDSGNKANKNNKNATKNGTGPG